MNNITTNNDGKEKHSSWEASVKFQIIGEYDFVHEVEIETYGRSEKEAVDNLMIAVTKTEQSIKEKIDSIRKEYESSDYDETDVTLNRYMY